MSASRNIGKFVTCVTKLFKLKHPLLSCFGLVNKFADVIDHFADPSVDVIHQRQKILCLEINVSNIVLFI